MHLSERTVFSLIRLMETHLPEPPSQADPRRLYFLLFLRRQLELCSAAVQLSRQTDDIAPPSILLRSALECSVDLQNLCQHEHYHLVLRAIELDNRLDLFRYKAEPAYSQLTQELGAGQMRAIEKKLKAQLQEALKAASQHFPLLGYQQSRLNIINRFRIAGREEEYQNRYTLYSTAAHNALSMMAIEQELGAHLDLEDFIRTQTTSTVLEFLVQALQHQSKLFYVDEELIREAMDLLSALNEATPRLPKNGK